MKEILSIQNINKSISSNFHQNSKPKKQIETS